MEKLNLIEDLTILEITKIELSGVLLEIKIKVQRNEQYDFFSTGINHDGESIFFRKGKNVNELDYTDSIYKITLINKYSADKLVNIINTKIKNILFGFEKNEMIEKRLYYLKISTDKTEFLFFNNGDNGYCAIDNIEKILSNDIYGYKWEDTWTE